MNGHIAIEVQQGFISPKYDLHTDIEILFLHYLGSMGKTLQSVLTVPQRRSQQFLTALQAKPCAKHDVLDHTILAW